MRFSSLMLYAVLLTLLTGCEWMDPRLTIVNHSQYAIAIEHASDTIPYHNSPNTATHYLSPEARHIDSPLPGDTVRLQVWEKNGWVDTIAHSKNNKVNLFIFSLDTIRKYKQMDIIKQKRLYERISLSQQQLQSRNWVVGFYSE